MKTFRKLGWMLLLILALLGMTSVALAQVSMNTDFSWHVLASGGGVRSSTGYLLQDVVGQTASNRTQSEGAVVQAGFLASITSAGTLDNQSMQLYLPAILR